MKVNVYRYVYAFGQNETRILKYCRNVFFQMSTNAGRTTAVVLTCVSTLSEVTLVPVTTVTNWTLATCMDASVSHLLTRPFSIDQVR